MLEKVKKGFNLWFSAIGPILTALVGMAYLVKGDAVGFVLVVLANIWANPLRTKIDINIDLERALDQFKSDTES